MSAPIRSGVLIASVDFRPRYFLSHPKHRNHDHKSGSADKFSHNSPLLRFAPFRSPYRRVVCRGSLQRLLAVETDPESPDRTRCIQESLRTTKRAASDLRQKEKL